MDVEGLHDQTTNTYPTDAAIVATVKTLAGANVLGATDLPLTYVAGTRKPHTIYRALLPHTVELPDPEYKGVFTITRAGAVRELNARISVIDG